MKTITAHEARQLSGPTVDEQVELACKEIRIAAHNGVRSVSLRSDFWTYGGYDNKPDYKKAVEKLENLGFDVSFKYNDGFQFVDMYTKIEW